MESIKSIRVRHSVAGVLLLCFAWCFEVAMFSCFLWIFLTAWLTNMDPDTAPNSDPGLITETDDPGLNTEPEPTLNEDLGLNTEPEPTLNDDPGLNAEPEPTLNDDPGLIMDNETDSDPVTVPSSAAVAGSSRHSARVGSHCVNCRVNMRQLRSHQLEIVEVRSVVQQWLLPQRVHITSADFVCHSCWTAAWNEVRGQPATSVASPQSTRDICIGCGHSLRRQRFHTLSGDSQREILIRNIISGQIAPRLLHTSDRICHPCWQRSDRAAGRNVVIHEPSPLSGEHDEDGEEDETESESVTSSIHQVPSTIFLPSYTRAPDTQRRCFMPGCTQPERLVVPASLRALLFRIYKYYVPPQCRICFFHLRSNSWHILEEIINPIQMFSASHIEDYTELLMNHRHVLDFENINSIPDHMFHIYLGLTKTQFNTLITEVPNLSRKHRGVFALAAYLIKLRTGDSDERISSLLQVPRSTLERLMKMAREIIKQDFVPLNLGINHITREAISQRNLIIPNGLFGGEERHPIIIADGTYIYIEKSSNFWYQKKTYSLHKYRNLVKPFLLVCSDGYIIDVLGPYPATTSDADIMRREFSNENNAYTQYFQSGDVFILDRGFRDSISLLENCNYTVHTPMSLREGQTQLSTMDANKSRTVTMVRWVVETVNGIFKKSFKIFRQAFFNRASSHLMTDFSVAAALINKFHIRYTDRDDAQQILNVVNENLHRDNDLAVFVDERHLNRVRVTFTYINVQNDNVADFPELTISDLILFACGTYQLKLARSYYGEHVRSNGCYIIEISNDRSTSLFEGSHFGDNCLLLRARIQSRHITRRIYFVYILLRRNSSGRAAILQYCCNCIVGRRTVGCCAHVMSVVWYLGWARHQEVITPPANFLDSILLVYDDDD